MFVPTLAASIKWMYLTCCKFTVNLLLYFYLVHVCQHFSDQSLKQFYVTVTFTQCDKDLQDETFKKYVASIEKVQR